MKNTKYSKYKIAPIAEDKDGKFEFPKNGFIAYKKALAGLHDTKKCIVKLFIPAEAKKIAAQWNNSAPYAKSCGRTTAQHRAGFGGKMRANKAVVISIKTFGEKDLKEAYSMHISGGKRMKYAIGKTVTPATWNRSGYVICGGGIHFFRTKQEARNY